MPFELRKTDFTEWERPDRAVYHPGAPHSKIDLLLQV